MPTRIVTAGGFNNPSLNLNYAPDIAGAHQNALKTQALGQQNTLRGKTLGNYDQDRANALADKGVMDKRTSYYFLQKAAPTITPNNYYQQRETFVNEMGVDPSWMPDQAAVQAEAVKEGVTEDEAIVEWQKAFMPQAKAEKPGDVKTWMTPGGKIVNIRKGEMPPEGSVPFKGKGLDIQFGEDGRPISITQGGMPGGGGEKVTRKTKGAIESKLLGGQEQLARMQIMASEFRPEYLETGTRLAATWTSIKAKLGKNVDPESAKTLTDFKKFQRKSIENINLYIKELTGAQMSEKEADRLRLAQPDPGENWYSGDDPITFKAKMDDVLKFTRASVARYKFYRSKGLEPEQIEAIINSDTGLNLEDMASRMK